MGLHLAYSMTSMSKYLDPKIPRPWIGRASREVSPSMVSKVTWPHPIWCFLMVRPFPLSHDIAQLRERITHAIAGFDRQIWDVYDGNRTTGLMSVALPTVDKWNTCKICAKLGIQTLSINTSACAICHGYYYIDPRNLNCPVETIVVV